jgi:hypothetical protein
MVPAPCGLNSGFGFGKLGILYRYIYRFRRRIHGPWMKDWWCRYRTPSLHSRCHWELSVAGVSAYRKDERFYQYTYHIWINLDVVPHHRHYEALVL